MDLKIPARAFFSFGIPCPYRGDPPVIDGLLGEWGDASRVPDLAAIDGTDPFADVYTAWGEAGLYLAIRVRGAPGLAVQTARPLRGDGLQVWLDTRDVRDAHRASRYCHHFYFLPVGGGRAGKSPVAGQVRIRRARGQARMCRPEEIAAASRVSRRGYGMEIHIPGESLTGFDPAENSLLGFSYLLKDRKLGRQYLGADESLPLAYDPSLWTTLELQGGGGGST